jgi:hypothetical protein
LGKFLKANLLGGEIGHFFADVIPGLVPELMVNLAVHPLISTLIF